MIGPKDLVDDRVQKFASFVVARIEAKHQPYCIAWSMQGNRPANTWHVFKEEVVGRYCKFRQNNHHKKMELLELGSLECSASIDFGKISYTYVVSDYYNLFR